jgi:ABC-type phosphate transport system substrate-binding protein
MRRALSVATFLAFTALSSAVAGESHAPAFQMIVNPSNGATSVDREFLASAFLKKTTEWPSGEVIRPVDLPPSSPLRHRFSEEVLHRSVAEVKVYWQQRIFSGRDVPPPELDTDEAVVTYVLRHQGGVGYVSGTATLNGAKVVGVQ